ncbi:unnamed protein product [Rotaria sp. Silwood2]|nr:unnamed protein product [Rotaria sp. Silwood2]CAF2994579.1 unnamed protein product [Rotaria sp. Silwood2]CAF3300517.1 unnamed protein product [Rotaria sp. Silwood2]CAF3386351.1 unnamed protein product [Rotaria sp. Silwood2]CAF4067602.1 unnamed protein product [Rotaria sp. Silwood2]
MYGNKTDQCPNCKNIIRQPMFAYHCENNNTDVNAIDTDADSIVDNSVASSTLQSNHSSLFSTRLAAGHEKHIMTMQVDLEMLPNKDSDSFQRSSSGRL